MRKIVIFILSLLFMLPVFAGPYEEALNKGENVFLYMYTENCKYCKQFDPVFEKLNVQYKNRFKFVKIDADTKYGHFIMFQYQARYVPFVVMVNANKQILSPISPECLLESACVEKEMKQFIK